MNETMFKGQEMTGIKVLALTPIIGAGFISAMANSAPEIEWGAFSLCALVVVFLCSYLKNLTAEHRAERKDLVDSLQKKDAEIVRLIEQNTHAYNRLAQLLGDRPCLYRDARIQD